ncbi:MAG: lytic transglycosylase domain-containing protein [Sulfurimonas sp.]|jgi:soluble lytic murein transglycosylase-like protein
MIKALLLWIMMMAAANAATNMWIRTGDTYGIDPRLLYAISKVESDLHPLNISVNYQKLTKVQLDKLYLMLKNRGIPYKTFTKVVAIENENITQAKYVISFLDGNHYPSFDIGLMQVNNIHKEVLAGMKISLYSLLNQETNLNVSAAILWECYKKHGSTYKAINAYNGRVAGNPYYSKVSAELQKLLLPNENSSKRLFYGVL